MSKTKEETVQQWREALKESARTAVEALSAVTPIEEDVEAPTTDEASEILGHAILKIRELMRPAPKTVAFLEEEAWYRMKGAGKPAGEYRTPKSALDFVMANPPLNIPPAAEPIQPGTPQMVPGEQPWKAIDSDSIGIRASDAIIQAWHMREGASVEVYAKRNAEGCWSFTATVDCEKVVFGTVIGGRNRMNAVARHLRNGLISARLKGRHYRANRAAKAAAVAVAAVPKVPNVPTVPAAPHPAPLTPEEELADTIKRQKESEAL